MRGEARNRSYIYGARLGSTQSQSKIKVMKKGQNDIKTVREILMDSEVIFTIRGMKDAFRTRKEYDGEKTGSIWDAEPMGRGMNVNKFGPTCVTLYSFDMMSNKTVAKIRYADVEIIEEIKK